MTNWDNPKTEDLLTAILALQAMNEAKRFFRDLLTENELIEFDGRWQAAQWPVTDYRLMLAILGSHSHHHGLIAAGKDPS